MATASQHKPTARPYVGATTCDLVPDWRDTDPPVTVYSSPEFRALAQYVLDRPGDEAPTLVLSDWLRDHGLPEQKCVEAIQPPVWSSALPTSYHGAEIRNGDGRGIGHGIGSGRGIGNWIGSGNGNGDGVGSGNGLGIGIGSGNGNGLGIGIGSRIGRKTLMEPGKAYLIETVDWFAWVGRVTRQVGPWEYELESCSKIAETNNGDNWEKLAAGDMAARQAATYRHYTTPVILGLGAVAKIEWVGKTPQEAGLEAG